MLPKDQAMPIPTNAQIAEWLGLWIPSQACERDSDIPISYPCHRNDPKGPPHWQRAPWHHIPPPDLTSDALYRGIITALNEKGYRVSFYPDKRILVYDTHCWTFDDEMTLLDAARAAYEREDSK